MVHPFGDLGSPFRELNEHDDLYGRVNAWLNARSRENAAERAVLEMAVQGDDYFRWLVKGITTYARRPGDEIEEEDREEYAAQELAYYLDLVKKRADKDMARGGEDSPLAALTFIDHVQCGRMDGRVFVILARLAGYPPFVFKEVVEASSSAGELESGDEDDGDNGEDED